MHVSLCSLSVIICASNNIQSAKYSYYLILLYEVGFKPTQQQRYLRDVNEAVVDQGHVGRTQARRGAQQQVLVTLHRRL